MPLLLTAIRLLFGTGSEIDADAEGVVSPALLSIILNPSDDKAREADLRFAACQRVKL